MVDSVIDCDVLIVGAGPTGLTAAALLRRAGVRVRIVDKRKVPSDKSRALAIQARTLELLGQIGLVQQFLDEGVRSESIDFFVAGRRAGGFSYDLARSPDTPFPFVLQLPQARTEAILTEDLNDHGLVVERGITVTNLVRRDDRVFVDTLDEAGTPGRICAAYVIGADGAHSAVRELVGIPFEGMEHPARFMLADCAVRWPGKSAFDPDGMHIFMRGEAIAIFLPISGAARSRVIVVDRSRDSDPTDGGGPTIAEVEAAFAAAVGKPVTLTEAVWLSRYSVSSRMVPGYRRGRVFLAGDAAHIHSPAGGQGMNTGMQDAANLAWKLAAVIRHSAADALLDTYDLERRPVAREVLGTSDRMFNAVAEKTGWRAMLRDWAARATFAVVPRLSVAQRNAFRRIAQLEIAYPSSMCVEADDPRFGSDGPHPGQRAPNGAIAPGQRVFDLLTGVGTTVLVFAKAPDGSPLRAALRHDLALLEREGVTAHVIERGPALDGAVAPMDAYRLFGLKSLDAQAIYVIRPDSYVAWRRRGLDLDACRSFLDRTTGSSSPTELAGEHGKTDPMPAAVERPSRLQAVS